MAEIGNWILSFTVAGIILFGLIKGVNVFDCFLEGAKDGLNIAVKILPAYVGLITATSMIGVSGGLDVLTHALSPLAKFLGLPEEVMPLAILRPISGGGAVALFENLLSDFGPDTYIGRVASVMMGSAETTFYAITVYYGSIGVQKTRHTVVASLSADLAGFIMSAITVRYILG